MFNGMGADYSLITTKEDAWEFFRKEAAKQGKTLKQFIDEDIRELLESAWHLQKLTGQPESLKTTWKLRIGEGEYICRDCGSRTFTLNYVHPNVGMFCSKCFGWKAWLKKSVVLKGFGGKLRKKKIIDAKEPVKGESGNKVAARNRVTSVEGLHSKRVLSKPSDEVLMTPSLHSQAPQQDEDSLTRPMPRFSHDAKGAEKK